MQCVSLTTLHSEPVGNPMRAMTAVEAVRSAWMLGDLTRPLGNGLGLMGLLMACYGGLEGILTGRGGGR